MTIPFEQRVFPAMYPSIGRRGSLVVFCPASNMTPDMVERLVLEAEEAIGAPVRHTIRKLFPKKLECSIAAEVARAWKARRGTLMLSNQLSSPTHLRITANRFPRGTGAAYPADFGFFSIEIDNAAPRALDLLARLPAFAKLCGAFMARADSPEWGNSMSAVLKEREMEPRSLIRGLRFVAEEGWCISERFGWGTYIGPRCARAFGSLSSPEVVEHATDGSAMIWLTTVPFDFRIAEHLRRHTNLLDEVAAHAHSGTQISEL
jgi:hypothetical protein